MAQAFVIINEEQWGIDQNAFFKFGEGFWAKVASATVEFLVFVEVSGEVTLGIMVRTGTIANATEFVPGYVVSVDGVPVPMLLDTTKPNELKTNIFGGSYIGYIKGRITIKDTKKHVIKVVSKQYGGFSEINLIEPNITQADIDLAVSKAKVEENLMWVEKIKGLESVKAAADGIKTMIDVIIS